MTTHIANRPGAANPLRRLPQVFDRYMLPKVAFTVITVASLAGAVLTGMRHGLHDWPTWALRWAAYYTLALLTGAEVWKLFCLRPALLIRPTANATDYASGMLSLYRRWQQILLPLVLLFGGANLLGYAARYGAVWPWTWIALGGLATVSVAVPLSWLRQAVDGESGAGAPQTGRPGAGTAALQSGGAGAASAAALAGLATAIAAMAGMDVSLQAYQAPWLLIPSRIIHLWAFSAWLGGAMWNIFIAVPAGVARENMDTVILANVQLERFRWVVRLVFPAIIATGLVQAWAMFGFRWDALFTNTWGYLILTKLGFISLLVVIFITCPMWRACSPIRGVCNLEDL